jgi:hypothetical protein
MGAGAPLPLPALRLRPAAAAAAAAAGCWRLAESVNHWLLGAVGWQLAIGISYRLSQKANGE